MKRLYAGLLICGFVGAGCGGMVPSVFVGSYTGTYSAPTLPQTGNVNLSVDQFGNLSGSTTVSTGAGSSYNITGTLNDSNVLNGSLTVPGGATPAASFSGSFLPGTPVGNTVPYTASLTVIPTGAASYADTWTLDQEASGLSKHQLSK